MGERRGVAPGRIAFGQWIAGGRRLAVPDHLVVLLARGALPVALGPVPVGDLEVPLDVLGLLVLEVDVPRVLPRVERHERRLRVLRERAPGVLERHDVELLRETVVDEPDPAGAEEAHRLGLELLDEGLPRAVLLLNRAEEVGRDVAPPRRDVLPEEGVVVVLGGVVEDGDVVVVVRGRQADDVVEVHALVLGARQQRVELLDVEAVVAAVVDAQLLARHERRAALVRREIEDRQVEETLGLDVALRAAHGLVGTPVQLTVLGHVVVGRLTGALTERVVLSVDVELAHDDVTLRQVHADGALLGQRSDGRGAGGQRGAAEHVRRRTKGLLGSSNGGAVGSRGSQSTRRH
mmetsp:Transcript_45787/g.141067  ORF Transcript_45787/g.141067 Transcript_45787/m.141067 type:complete len:349 (-) Transcript_45787:47-1093(-)